MCAWDKSLPAGADKIKDSDDNIRANNAAIETVLGTNITTGPTTIQGAIQGDTTKGRKLRAIRFSIDDGTNAATLKCAVTSVWNGDVIAETDNIAKDAITGNFTLDAAGALLRIENAGLSGAVLYCLSNLYVNQSGVDYNSRANAFASDITVRIYGAVDGLYKDITGIVDGGYLLMDILYITDA